MSWLYDLLRRGYESDSGYEGDDERDKKRAKKEPNAKSADNDTEKKKKEAKPETDSEAKPETDSEAKPETDSEAKPETDSEAKPETDSEAKPETDSKAKPETDSEAAAADSDTDFKPVLKTCMVDFRIFNQLESGDDVEVVYIDANNNEVNVENNNEVVAANNNEIVAANDESEDESEDENQDENQGDGENDGNEGDDGNQADDESDESDDKMDESDEMHQRENKKRKKQVLNRESQIPANDRSSSPKKAKLEIDEDQEMHDDSQVLLPLSEMPAGPSRVLAVDDVQNVGDVSRMRNFADSDMVGNLNNFGNAGRVMLRVDSDTAVVPSGDNVLSDDSFSNVCNDTDTRAVPIVSDSPILRNILTAPNTHTNYRSAANNGPVVNNSAQNVATDQMNVQNAANEEMEAENAPDEDSVSSDEEYFQKKDSQTEDEAENVDNAQNDAPVVDDLPMEIDDAVVPEMEHHLEQLVQLY